MISLRSFLLSKSIIFAYVFILCPFVLKHESQDPHLFHHSIIGFRMCLAHGNSSNCNMNHSQFYPYWVLSCKQNSRINFKVPRDTKLWDAFWSTNKVLMNLRNVWLFYFQKELFFLFFFIWNASRICVSSLRRGHANLLCIVPISVYVLPKRAQFQKEFKVVFNESHIIELIKI